MTVVMNVILNPDKVGMKDLVFILTEIDSSSPDLVGVLRMTAKKVIPRPCGAQNDSGDERHPESRQSRDEGSCNLGNMGFFAPAALRMTAKKVIPRPCGAQNDSEVDVILKPKQSPERIEAKDLSNAMSF